MSMTAASASAAHSAIRLFELDRQRARLRHEFDKRIAAVLDHGQFILGPEVDELEASLASFAGVRHAIGVSSGRDALIMSLMAHGIGPGDGVLVPAFTFSATAAVVVSVGASPVFVDVCEDTMNMNVDAIGSAVAAAHADGLRPRAIMPVDLFGRPADYAAIAVAADAHGLAVIADAAQSFGAAIGDTNVGALAPITCVSFYPTKPLGAFGDGGAILTDDDALAESVRLIRTHGRQGEGDEALRIGMTGRLDTIQAAVLLAKMPVFRAELRRRAEIAAHYNAHLSDLCGLPVADDTVRSAWALYTVKIPGGRDARDAVRTRLAEDGIGTGLFYRVPLPRHAAFACFRREATPVADRLADRVLSLPIGPDVTDAEAARVVDALRAAV